MLYITLALWPSMLSRGTLRMVKEDVTVDHVKRALEDNCIVSIRLSKRNLRIVGVLREKYNIDLRIYKVPPLVYLKAGDSVILFQALNLPAGDKKFSEIDVDKVKFTFDHIQVTQT